MSDDESPKDPPAPEAEQKAPRRRRGRPIFERPPFAKEIFTEETKKIFDQLPGRYRHFVKQLVSTGNPRQAARLSGIKELESAAKAEKQIEISEALTRSSLGVEDLVGYLIECVKAEELIRDKSGNMYTAVRLGTRLEAIKFICLLHGLLGPKKSEKKDTLMEMFSSVDPEAE